MVSTGRQLETPPHSGDGRRDGRTMPQQMSPLHPAVQRRKRPVGTGLRSEVRARLQHQPGRSVQAG